MAEEKKKQKKRRPKLTAEEKENELIGLAVDLAEKQLREGTAKSQVIVHYLKLASAKEKDERELLKTNVELQKAKAESLNRQERIEELYQDALDAMMKYRPQSNMEEEYFDE